MPFSTTPAAKRRLSTRTVVLVLLGVVLLVSVAAALVKSPVNVSANVSGKPFVIDGDTLDFSRPAARVRIAGIDAPELEQTCRDAGGTEWPCGATALETMRDLVADGVRCSGNDIDRYGRFLVTCVAAGGDVGAAMVLAGMAVASGRYGEEEQRAREQKLGIWVGEFERPRAFRQRAEGFNLWDWIMGLFGR